MPSPVFQPYPFAMSYKFNPRSSARSMMANESGSVVSGPKFIVPRQKGLTFRPVRPRYRYSMVELVVAPAEGGGNRGAGPWTWDVGRGPRASWGQWTYTIS